MTEVEASEWEKDRFGPLAVELRAGVIRAIQHAHERAVRSQLSSELDTHDAYGSVIHVWQFELLAALAQDIPGLLARKPTGSKGSRFDLLVAGNVVIYPWRYAKDRRTHREDAQIPRVERGARSMCHVRYGATPGAGDAPLPVGRSPFPEIRRREWHSPSNGPIAQMAS